METQTVENDPRVMWGGPPVLLDETRKLYRFEGGICRQLSKVAAPWRIETEFVHNDPLGFLYLALAADTTAFGIVPGLMPSGNPRSGWGQEKVEVLFGLAGPGHWRESIVRTAVFDLPDWAFKQPSYPISSSFQSKTNNGENIVLSNTELKTGVFCDIEDPETWPNPRCHGFVFLENNEMAYFKLSYDGLIRLDEVVRSIIQQARAMRTTCPEGSKAP